MLTDPTPTTLARFGFFMQSMIASKFSEEAVLDARYECTKEIADALIETILIPDWANIHEVPLPDIIEKFKNDVVLAWGKTNNIDPEIPDILQYNSFNAEDAAPILCVPVTRAINLLTYWTALGKLNKFDSSYEMVGPFKEFNPEKYIVDNYEEIDAETVQRLFSFVGYTSPEPISELFLRMCNNGTLRACHDGSFNPPEAKWTVGAATTHAGTTFTVQKPTTKRWTTKDLISGINYMYAVAEPIMATPMPFVICPDNPDSEKLLEFMEKIGILESIPESPITKMPKTWRFVADYLRDEFLIQGILELFDKNCPIDVSTIVINFDVSHDRAQIILDQLVHIGILEWYRGQLVYPQNSNPIELFSNPFTLEDLKTLVNGDYSMASKMMVELHKLNAISKIECTQNEWQAQWEPEMIALWLRGYLGLTTHADVEAYLKDVCTYAKDKPIEILKNLYHKIELVEDPANLAEKFDPMIVYAKVVDGIVTCANFRLR